MRSCREYDKQFRTMHRSEVFGLTGNGVSPSSVDYEERGERKIERERERRGGGEKTEERVNVFSSCTKASLRCIFELTFKLLEDRCTKTPHEVYIYYQYF